MNISGRVQKTIEISGLSRNAFAQASGVPQPRLYEIVQGKTEDPRASTLIKIAAAAGVSLTWLLTGEGDMLPAGKVAAVELKPDQQHLLDLWTVADEQAREYALMILEKSAKESREKDGGGLDSAGNGSA